MGNGAGVPLDYSDSNDFHNQFSRLEKKVKQGFFQQCCNEKEYLEVTEAAIKDQRLDILELLIRGGNIDNLCPLHICARHSSVDAMELLLSAGLSPLDKDIQGKTPLHHVPYSSSDDSMLTAYLLLLRGEKALKIKDNKGNTPLHLAVLKNKPTIVEIMLSHGASLSINNNAGVSPRHLAKNMEHHDIVRIIDEKRTGKRLKNEAPPKMTKHQHERIMKVWERFFENALMGVDLDIDDDEKHDGICEISSKKDQSENKLTDALFKHDEYSEHSLYPSESKNYDYNFTYGGPEKLSYKYDECSSSYKEVYENVSQNESLDDQIYYCAAEWFSWVLSYEADPERRHVIAKSTGGDGTDGYYTANCLLLDQAFDALDNHLDRQMNHLGWQGYSYADSKSSADYFYGSGGYDESEEVYRYYFPGTVKDAIASGWIVFYDSFTNSCCWMHVSTGMTESHLPLGHDPLAWELGLEQDSDDVDFDVDCWLKPPQVVARSWVLVSLSPDEYSFGVENENKIDFDDEAAISDALWYYSNRVTGHSSWDEPTGWDNIVTEAGGWVLCAEETNPLDLYWWHSVTGDVIWYSDDYE